VLYYGSSESATDSSHEIVSVLVGQIEYMFGVQGIERIVVCPHEDPQTSTSTFQRISDFSGDLISSSNIATGQPVGDVEIAQLAGDFNQIEVSNAEREVQSPSQHLTNELENVASLSGNILLVTAPHLGRAVASALPESVPRSARPLIADGVTQSGRMSGNVLCSLKTTNAGQRATNSHQTGNSENSGSARVSGNVVNFCAPHLGRAVGAAAPPAVRPVVAAITTTTARLSGDFLINNTGSSPESTAASLDEAGSHLSATFIRQGTATSGNIIAGYLPPGVRNFARPFISQGAREIGRRSAEYFTDPSNTVGRTVINGSGYVSGMAVTGSKNVVQTVSSSGNFFRKSVCNPVRINEFLMVNIIEILGHDRAKRLKGKLKDLSSRRPPPDRYDRCGSTAMSFDDIENRVDELGRGKFQSFNSRTNNCHHFVQDLIRILTGELFEIPENGQTNDASHSCCVS